MPKKNFPPLDDEKLKVVPYGKPNCRICQLPIDDLKTLHEMRFDKHVKHKDIQLYLRDKYKIADSTTKVHRHFKEHVHPHEVLLEGIEDKEVQRALVNIPQNQITVKNADLESAFSAVVRLSRIMVERIGKVTDKFDYTDAALDVAFTKMDPLTAYEKISKLQRDAVEQIKSITALRAPKVVVANFLEQAINQVIYDTGSVLTNMCNTIHDALSDSLKEHDIQLDDGFFQEIFKNAGREFQKQMEIVRREQINKATVTLSEMEKIV